MGGHQPATAVLVVQRFTSSPLGDAVRTGRCLPSNCRWAVPPNLFDPRVRGSTQAPARLVSAGKGRNMSTVDVGPVDVVMLRFPGNQFKGEIAPALRDLVVRDLVRVIDLLFVYKAEDGTVGSIELAGLGPELEPAFVDLDGQLGGGLLDAEDVDEVAVGLAPNSSVAVLIVENTWAIPFVKAVRNAGGEVADQARIPASVVQRVLEDAAGEG